MITIAQIRTFDETVLRFGGFLGDAFDVAHSRNCRQLSVPSF
jgi:hypothetical protein